MSPCHEEAVKSCRPKCQPALRPVMAFSALTEELVYLWHVCWPLLVDLIS